MTKHNKIVTKAHQVYNNVIKSVTNYSGRVTRYEIKDVDAIHSKIAPLF